MEGEVFSKSHDTWPHSFFPLHGSVILVPLQKNSSKPNVAVKGQAVQSSTLYPAAANRAIDGRRDTYYTESSCSHTQEETAPWWRVDLGQIFVVSTIKVTNRGDCCPERLDGAQIHIGNSLQNNGNNNPRCATITHIPLGDTFSFTCESGKMTGRYVNLVLPGDKKILTLCEVEVYAKPPGERRKYERKYTHQSSSWEPDGTPAGAYKAVKNCNRYKFTQYCCSRTEEEWDPWWRVDLGAVYRISAVVIYNRKDCCSDYITGAKIKIGKSLSHKDNPVCATVHSADLDQAFYCSEMEGQYVSLNIPQKINLTICGVEVFGSQVGMSFQHI
uniref:Fucolectin tachylectin-4 pentraxin-1 domain-containing protein n=1 Tax=Periophthalmus magnuspinnatus TaxID=409849 RepID=A0A3B3ZRQ7_9GOBI